MTALVDVTETVELDGRRYMRKLGAIEVDELEGPPAPARKVRNSTRTKETPSKQDYETPPELLAACAARFGPLAVDLACTRENAKAPHGCYFPEVDSLAIPWAERWPDDVLWLNPPFSRIEPWAAKCRDEGARMKEGLILLLTPASVGANWFLEHVWGSALVLPLAPRLTFVGASDPYPKDCMISVFGRAVPSPSQGNLFPDGRAIRPGFEPWRWMITGGAK